MDNLNLNSNETIIQKTQIVIITGVRHEAVLTSRRLILIENETGRIHEDIPFAEFERAISGVNKLREPIITLVVNTPGSDKRTLELIFIHFIGDKNIVELEKCLSVLKEHNVPIEGISPLTIRALLIKVDRKNQGMLVVEDPVSRPVVPEWTVFGPLRNNKQSLEEEEYPELKPLHTLAIIFLIFVVMIAGITLVGQTLQEKTQPDPLNMTASAVKSGVTISPSPAQTPTPASRVTPVPTESLPQILIPPTGVWVRVQYPGNFSGTIGAMGRIIDVSGSGIQWYQLPVVDPTLDGTIAKLDGTSDKMLVETYKDGNLISRKSTKSPYGSIELQGTGSEDLTTDAATNNIVPNYVVTTPVPSLNIQTTEEYLPMISIPTTGVWVRVYYPGYFSGTVGGRGLSTPIQSTGDQLYEIPANVGIVEGSIEKNDASDGKMVTEVYKDGTLISRMETKKPQGLIDIHVPV